MSATATAAPKGEAVVIGAGIVGVCCALYLQRDGHSVTLVDPRGVGLGASFGNAGNLGWASCVPAAMPGVLKKVPQMLFDGNAPLKLHWGHVPAAAGWFARFIAAARPSRIEAIADARQALLARLHEGYAPLLEAAGAEDLIDYSGLLMTWESDEAFAGSRYALELRRRRGVPMDELDGNEARQMEPALAPSVMRAVHFPRLAHVIDPLRLTETLARHFEQRGGRIRREAARGFEMGPSGPVAVTTDAGRIAADRFIVAAGVWSKNLARQLGTRTPIEAERGYHNVFPQPGIALRAAIMSADRYIAVTPMEAGIRATGVAEFADPDRPADMRYAEMVERRAQGLLPGLKTEGRSQWMGPRPSHPDSLPVIGRSPRFGNVVFAYGHDHIGLALGGITGRLVADIVAGRPTPVDLTPYRPDRF
ncbi:D-amino-acid dehydrogenase [Stella humosa]|uniref:D-amino-acid dehydrogenase n=1 Tax=Stella humosa TaxID=94 RepID=A0A3N1MGS2_9PROT|nr:FAD-dependent oxidoreductase [Stella humosa]ROQ00376.1 D-amino-acid dehydrogenase [Stella humosa]BBK30385.1 D-amino-acid dehydrogenase [Stella humosa]